MPDNKLNEARLRELAEALTFFRRYADETREATATRRNNNANDASKAILALLDALSAERERGDRAVGLLREMFEEGVGPVDIAMAGNPIAIQDLQSRVFDCLGHGEAS